MESLISRSHQFTRRDALQMAAGMGLSFLLPGISASAAEKRGSDRPKSLITLWMAGGPSQLETWDPHPGSEIGGPTKAIKTKLPGLQIADLFPQMAEQIHHLSVIRSLVSKEGDHERGSYFLKTGYPPDATVVHPSIGAVVTHATPNDKVEIPQHVSLCGGQWPARGGYLGDDFDAFKVFDPGKNVGNMRKQVGNGRQKRRLKNLEVVSQAFSQRRRFAVGKTSHQETITRALKMMRSKQLRAFELDDEPKTLVKAYGDTRFGRGCLVARRLIEEGVRAVEVTLNGFDTHTNNFEGHRTLAKILDPAFAALINDLKKRDLLESTVVLCIGEFGRGTSINPLDGRDHWPSGFSCVLGGGGLRSQQVIGKTDRTGKKKAPENPIEVPDLYATLFKTLGVDYEEEQITPIGRPLAFCPGTPIEQLLG